MRGALDELEPRVRQLLREVARLVEVRAGSPCVRVLVADEDERRLGDLREAIARGVRLPRDDVLEVVTE